MGVEDKITAIRNKLRVAESNRDIVKGQISQLEADLKSKYKISTVEEAAKLLERKTKQIQAKTNTLSRGIEELQELLP